MGVGVSEEPRLHPRSDNDRSYVPTREVKMTTLNGSLPWYSILRINPSQLWMLGLVFVLMTGVYFKVQAHETEIANVKATAQTKEAATADLKLILDRIDALKDHVDTKFDTKFDDLKQRLERVEKQTDRRR